MSFTCSFFFQCPIGGGNFVAFLGCLVDRCVLLLDSLNEALGDFSIVGVVYMSRIANITLWESERH